MTKNAIHTWRREPQGQETVEAVLLYPSISVATDDGDYQTRHAGARMQVVIRRYDFPGIPSRMTYEFVFPGGYHTGGGLVGYRKLSALELLAEVAE